MGNVKAIADAVESLQPSELTEFRHWFFEFDAGAWDHQIDQDATAGKLHGMAAEALSEHCAGPVREL